MKENNLHLQELYWYSVHSDPETLNTGNMLTYRPYNGSITIEALILTGTLMRHVLNQNILAQ